VQVATEQKTKGAARKTASRLLKQHGVLKPVNNISLADSVSDWTFRYVTKKGADAVLLGMDAIEYAVEALTGAVKNNKETLREFVQSCKSTFPSRKRGPPANESGAGGEGIIAEQTRLPVQALVRFIQRGNLEVAKSNERMFESQQQGNLELVKYNERMFESQQQGNLELVKYNEMILESQWRCIESQQQGNMELVKFIGAFQAQSSSELAEAKAQMLVCRERAEQVAVLVAEKEYLTKRNHELEMELALANEHKRMKTEVGLLVLQHITFFHRRFVFSCDI
jgi:hypothetical protein